LPVARGAAICAEFYGSKTLCVTDVGVAGIHRLLARIEEIRAANVVVAVAGMEGALAGVIAGLVSAPVIALPTSVGYGASFGGVSALLGMLTACSPGIAVVNIDNGFGAGYLANQINQGFCKR
jgi:NCAIR mutase (PurE)-related protein